MKFKVCMIQQSVWKVKVQSVPLAMGYLKACALKNKIIADYFNLEIHSFNLAQSNKHIVNQLFMGGVPDIVCFSVQGWNINNFAQICKFYKASVPYGKIILGGVHVSNQAEKIFRLIPEADIISNGEGEITFQNLLLNYFQYKFEKETLFKVKGISFVFNEKVVTTKEQEVVENLDDIPSPYLNNIIQMNDKNGDFLYDVALMETSRGCPYQCSYCSWSEVIGKKTIRHFGIKRLEEELLFFAKNKIKDIVLCDSNFGLYEEDEQFVDLFIKINQKYHYPENIECSWASGIPETTLRIWEKLYKNGIKNNFSFALQSINSEVLRNIRRKNMSWEYLVYIKSRTEKVGINFFIELIWGLPGETVESFITNINKLSALTKRFAVYPLVVLPKSKIVEDRDKYELQTIKESDNDFEYVVSNYSLSQEENFRFTKYVFWIRILSENMIFRSIWDVVQNILGYQFFDVVKLFTDYLVMYNTGDECGTMLRELTLQCDLHSKVPETILYIYSHLEDFKNLVYRWWEEGIVSKTVLEYREYFAEVIRYEMITLPQINFPDNKYIKIGNDDYFVKKNIKFQYDFLTNKFDIKQKALEVSYDIRYRVGFQDYMYNQEFIPQYLGIVDYHTAKKD